MLMQHMLSIHSAIITAYNGNSHHMFDVATQDEHFDL